jgi:hypothetical protein
MFVTQYRNVNGVLVLRFSEVASGAVAGEVVDVLGRDCGAKASDVRLISQTQTRAGGGWQVENPEQQPPWRSATVGSGAEFRARWKGRLSDPYVWRLQAPLSFKKVPGRRAWKVLTSPPNALVSMKEKIVELQRKSGERWVRYQRAKLAYRPSFTLGPFNHEAVFSVPMRGLTLRALLPTASAAPCYLKTVTGAWRS